MVMIKHHYVITFIKGNDIGNFEFIQKYTLLDMYEICM